MELSTGQIVYVKRGRDAGHPFIVVAVENGYAMLADGKRRVLAKPKRKKHKHMQPTNHLAGGWIQKQESGQMISDADIRKMLVAYRGQDGSAFE